MKHIAYLFSFLVIAISSCTNASLSINDNGAYFVDKRDYQCVNTLTELRAINMRIASHECDSFITRAGNRINWRYLAKADALGAIYGFDIGNTVGSWTVSFMGPSGYVGSVFAGALVGGCLFSAKACMVNRAQSLSNIDEHALFDSLRIYTNRTVSFADSSLIVRIPSDSILQKIEVSDTYIELKKVGASHNRVLDSFFGNEKYSISDSDSVYIRDSNPDYLIVSVTDTIFNNNDFQTWYSQTSTLIDTYFNRNEMDISRFVSDHYSSHSPVKQIADLFLEAMDNVNPSQDEIIDMVNNYIRVIESNNELNFEQKTQLFYGFVVAIYSSILWQQN